ncbi:MAG: GntR family transcriptional regulator, partial [Solirubrobacteraceae bacterium]
PRAEAAIATPTNTGDVRGRPSLVDSAEQALRNWLVPGRHRTGDRLPPEHEVALMLGISRGTLRTALQRLEESGDIVRRQGSGTFVGRVSVPTQLDERLDRLEPYSSLARRRGVELAAVSLEIEERAVGREVGELLELEPRTPVTTISRVLVAAGRPVAVMLDITHPTIELPPLDRLRRDLERGLMVLDVLAELGVRIAFARTRVMPRLLAPREPVGKALQIRRSTAVLELEELIYAGGGEPIAFSCDLFAPGALDVHIMRSVESPAPEPIVTAARGPGRQRRRARS